MALAALAEQDAAPRYGCVGAIWGMPGVGKTTLAVHLAHQLADRYPDGQLYVNLRGFDPDQDAMDTSVALGGFLQALGLSEEAMPTTAEERAALYQRRLVGRKVLVLLDNARDSEQVRLLLPAPSSSSLAIVTSRNRLESLLVRDGAVPVNLDIWSQEEALQALAARIGATRVAKEPKASAELVELCGRLPLAIALLGARVQSSPRSLTNVVRELREDAGTLAAFATRDRTTDVRTVFSWSYSHLPPNIAHLFRLLSLHPGLAISVAAAASLCGISAAEARSGLRELACAHLVAETPCGRYELHDLVRAYAEELARFHDSEADRAHAFSRLADHYRHTMDDADRQLGGFSALYRPTVPPVEGTVARVFTWDTEARDWITSELPALYGVHRMLVHAARLREATLLNWTLAGHAPQGGYAPRAEEAVRATRAASLAELPQEATTPLYQMLSPQQLDETRAVLERGLAKVSSARDPHLGDLARRHQTLGLLYYLQKRPEAVDHCQIAMALFRQTGNKVGLCDSSRTLVGSLLNNAAYEDAMREATLALESADADHHVERAGLLDMLGRANHHLGHYDRARQAFLAALHLFHNELKHVGSLHEYEVWVNLGHTYAALGDVPQARHCWESALRQSGRRPEAHAGTDTRTVHELLKALDQDG